MIHALVLCVVAVVACPAAPKLLASETVPEINDRQNGEADILVA